MSRERIRAGIWPEHRVVDVALGLAIAFAYGLAIVVVWAITWRERRRRD